MLKSVTIENFRGIEKLQLADLGRVNLFIGKNDSGKTSAIEAIDVVVRPTKAAGAVASAQQARGARRIDDFDDYWRSVFRDRDMARGFTVSTTTHADATISVSMVGEDLGVQIEEGSDDGIGVKLIPTSAIRWTHDFDAQSVAYSARITPGTVPANLLHQHKLSSPVWVGGRPNSDEASRALYSGVLAAGLSDAVLSFVRSIDPGITEILLLTPNDRGVLFARPGSGAPLLPLHAFGDGVRRAFEIAVGHLATEAPALFLDEVENGLHHSIHETLWTWIATLSKQRDLQVFATTHSEECTLAAAYAFKKLDDDGLRVIRLDRHEHETKAAVYSRDLVIGADEIDTEIRG